MNLWLLFGGLLGGLVFAGVIFWAFRMPDGEILRLSVRGEKIEYQLWQAELQVQLGRCSGVELVGCLPDPEAVEICRLFMRQRPWIRFSPEVCKSAAGVLY